MQGRGVCCPGGSCPGGSRRGVLVRGVFVRGFLSGGILSGGILTRGNLTGGILPWGILPGGFCPGGFCPGGFCPGGYCPGGFCPRTTFYIKFTPYVRLTFHVPTLYTPVSFPITSKSEDSTKYRLSNFKFSLTHVEVLRSNLRCSSLTI